MVWFWSQWLILDMISVHRRNRNTFQIISLARVTWDRWGWPLLMRQGVQFLGNNNQSTIRPTISQISSRCSWGESNNSPLCLLVRLWAQWPSKIDSETQWRLELSVNTLTIKSAKRNGRFSKSSRRHSKISIRVKTNWRLCLRRSVREFKIWGKRKRKRTRWMLRRLVVSLTTDHPRDEWAIWVTSPTSSSAKLITCNPNFKVPKTSN